MLFRFCDLNVATTTTTAAAATTQRIPRKLGSSSTMTSSSESSSECESTSASSRIDYEAVVSVSCPKCGASKRFIHTFEWGVYGELVLDWTECDDLLCLDCGDDMTVLCVEYWIAGSSSSSEAE